MIPSITNGHIEQILTNSESVDGDAYNGRLCLLYPDNVEDIQDLRDGYVNCYLGPVCRGFSGPVGML